MAINTGTYDQPSTAIPGIRLKNGAPSSLHMHAPCHAPCHTRWQGIESVLLSSNMAGIVQHALVMEHRPCRILEHYCVHRQAHFFTHTLNAMPCKTEGVGT